MDTTPYLAYPEVAPQARPSWFALPLLVHEEAPFSRQDITAYLEEAGVETRPIVAGNVAKHPAAHLFQALQEETYPGADTIHERGFYIGLSPAQDEGTMDRLLECFHNFFAEY